MPNIIECDNIIEAIRYLEPNHILGDCLQKEGFATKTPRYECVTMPDGTMGIMPALGNFTFYRGENETYDSCKSSLFRIGGREERVIALLRTYEFILFLKTLPEVQEYVDGNLYLDLWALAQHYEFATPMIDMTYEVAVAAFFATHYYDRVSKTYQIKTEGKGQIRGYSSIPDPAGRLRPIGVQPFARPGRQDGMALWIPETEDLADQSFKVVFQQARSINLRLDEAVLGGASYYFPNETMSRMAMVIKNMNAVTAEASDTFLNEVALGYSYIKPDVTEAEIRTILEKRRIFIVDAPVVCPEAMLPQYNGLYRQRDLITRPAFRG